MRLGDEPAELPQPAQAGARAAPPVGLSAGRAMFQAAVINHVTPIAGVDVFDGVAALVLPADLQCADLGKLSRLGSFDDHRLPRSRGHAQLPVIRWGASARTGVWAVIRHCLLPC